MAVENVAEVIEALYPNVPWTLSLIGILKSNNYENLIYDKNKHFIAVKNQWNEWICYIESKEYLEQLLQIMVKYLNDNRIIIFAKENIFTDLKDEKGEIIYRIEDFMYYVSGSQQGYTYNLATERDILLLSVQQADYCKEEVGWEAYHIDSSKYQEVYHHKIKNGKIFLDDSGRYSKVEVSDIYKHYGRISAVYTIPSKRRQGLSIQCLRGALTWAEENGITLCLNVRKENTPVVEMYHRLGFRRNGAVLYMKRF